MRAWAAGVHVTALSLITSLQATGVVLSPYQYSQLVLLLHSHDRHASDC